MKGIAPQQARELSRAARNGNVSMGVMNHSEQIDELIAEKARDDEREYFHYISTDYKYAEDVAQRLVDVYKQRLYLVDKFPGEDVGRNRTIVVKISW